MKRSEIGNRYLSIDGQIAVLLYPMLRTVSLVTVQNWLFQGGVYKRFLPPQVHIISKIGMSDFPRSDRLYSTFGGI